MIFTVLLGIVQNIVFIALMIDTILIIYQMLSLALGLNLAGRSKTGIIISVSIMIAIFYLDHVLFQIFHVHIISYPVFLI